MIIIIFTISFLEIILLSHFRETRITCVHSFGILSYCEPVKIGIKIKNPMVREVRKKTLKNLHYLTKKKVPNCDEFTSITTNRKNDDNYDIEVKCNNGKKINLPLNNEYLWIKFDEAFNDNNFLWDDVLISWWMMTTDPKLSISTLDFWYSQQIEVGDNKGLIPREITNELKSHWDRNDKRVSGPMFMSRVELDLFKKYGDTSRLHKVFPKLIEYFYWVENNRKVKVITNLGIVDEYLWSKWGSSMDNLPRCEDEIICGYSDLIAQQAAMASDIRDIANILEETDLIDVFTQKREYLAEQINKYYFDEEDSFVYDIDSNGQKLKSEQTAAFIWTLYAKVLDSQKTKQMIDNYLLDKKKFGGEVWMTSLSRDSVFFKSDGGYWQGGVWPPLVWIGYLSLKDNGYTTEAKIMANFYLSSFEELWKKDETLYEYYSPTLKNGELNPGKSPTAIKDFFGWGMLPVKLYFEVNEQSKRIR